MANTQNVEMYRGDDEFFDVIVTDSGSNLPIDLSVMTSRKFYFTVKQQYADSDDLILIRKTSASGEGITVIDGPNGKIRISLIRADTEQFNTPVAFYYDVRFKNSDGKTTTLVSGKLSIISNVTRTIA